MGNVQIPWPGEAIAPCDLALTIAVMTAPAVNSGILNPGVATHPISPRKTYVSGERTMGRKYQSILETVGNTPVVRINRLAPPGVNLYRQGRGVQSARLGQGPPGARRDRGGREVRRAEARPDGDRGDQRQHRHRPGHGLRGQGLSAGGDHGRDLQRRAAQADALPRRQGRPDAGRRARRRHDQQDDRAGQDARLVHDPAVRERGQPRLSLAHHRARDRRRFRRRRSSTTG